MRVLNLRDLNKLLPKVAVCVAMRNEEAVILNLVQSLVAQTYPNYHVFVIDDHSDDESVRVVSSFEASNFKVLQAKDGVAGKAACLHQLTKGLTLDYDVLAFTDADCVVDSFWVENMVKHLKTNDLVADETLVNGKGFLPVFEKIEYREIFGLVRLLGRLSSLPSMMGNNFAIRHTLFKSVDGYESLTDSIVEDVDLLKLVNAKGAKTVMAGDCKVCTTTTNNDWNALVSQRYRWSKGVQFNIGFLFIGLFLTSFKLVPYVFLLFNPVVGIVFFAVRWLITFCFSPIKFREIWSVIFFDLYQVILYVNVVLASKQRLVDWQGRKIKF